MKKFKIREIFIGAVVLLLIVGLVDKFTSKTKTIELNGQIFKIEEVNTPSKMQKGLSGRESMAEDEGMLFVFGDKDYRNFWMKDMNFAIDLLWIDGNLIVGFEENMQPEPNVPLERLRKYRSLQPVDKVLELPAGTIKKINIKAGQKINL